MVVYHSVDHTCKMLIVTVGACYRFNGKIYFCGVQVVAVEFLQDFAKSLVGDNDHLDLQTALPWESAQS